MKRTPREVVQRLIEGVPAREWAALPQLYAEDAVVEQPMALPRPIRLIGRPELEQHFDAAAQLPLEMRAVNLVLHDTSDSEVVVAEFDYEARNTATGATFTVANVFVVRVRHGLIVASRDYSNQVLFAAVFNRIEGLAHQLQAEFG
jgi:ketosteroid isomerase-like protein